MTVWRFVLIASGFAFVALTTLVLAEAPDNTPTSVQPSSVYTIALGFFMVALIVSACAVMLERLRRDLLELKVMHREMCDGMRERGDRREACGYYIATRSANGESAPISTSRGRVYRMPTRQD